MGRRVRRKVSQSTGGGKANSHRYFEIADADNDVDWMNLPADIVVQVFSRLNYPDRASLSLTCRPWWQLGSSPCLWTSLDLRSYKFDVNAADCLSHQCENIKKLQFRGSEAANAIIRLPAGGLCDISGEFCQDINDATLSMIAARHEALESLQLGPDGCNGITSDAIKSIASCCSNLRKLWISGVRVVNEDAINALAKQCGHLVEVGFINGENVDGAALGNLKSVRFMSVAGTRNMKWGSAVQPWSKLNNLIGIDVSRTDISSSHVTSLLSFTQNLKVLFALKCQKVEVDFDAISNKCQGKLLLALSSNIFKEVATLFTDKIENQREVFSYWRKLKNRDVNLDEVVTWIEWILSHSLLCISENSLEKFEKFWLRQGVALLLSLMHSSKEDVQERAAKALAAFVVVANGNATVDCRRAEAIIRDGGVQLLLNLANSCQEGLQLAAAKAIGNLSVNSEFAKAVGENGGIGILSNLAKSTNRLVAEEAAGGLQNLSVEEEHKAAVVGTGAIRALVDLIFKWQSSGDGVLMHAAGALANLAVDDKCSMEITMAGGVHALVMLIQSCKFEGVQEQAARALANLAFHGDSNSNNSVAGLEADALKALVRLTRSQHEGVRQEAAGALWNLSFDDKNRQAIAAAGGIEALVALARTCKTGSKDLQEKAAGALWGLSVSEAISIAIGRQGGVAPLIELAHSKYKNVHETAAGALWNLAFNPYNAIRIVENGGGGALSDLCSYSPSKTARFMAALTFAFISDGRVDEVLLQLSKHTSDIASTCRFFNTAKKLAFIHIESFLSTFTSDLAHASSSPTALEQAKEMACIQETGLLRCSGAEIERLLTMLKNTSPVLKLCAAFALFQFTAPSNSHAVLHTNLMKEAGAARSLRSVAASSTVPVEAKILAKILIQNLNQVAASV